jgi:hypothetical protein
MKRFTPWRRLAGAAALAILLGSAPLAARAADPARGSGTRAGFGAAGMPELAQIVRDIMLLRRINEIGLTRDQIGAVIPVLEKRLEDERTMGDDVKRLMLQQRRALLEGDVSNEQLQASGNKIKDRVQAFRNQGNRRLDGLAPTLKPDQIQKLRALVLAGPGVWGEGAGERQPRETRRPGPPREGGAEPARHQMGPSAQVLERVVSLLKEKRELMRPKG